MNPPFSLSDQFGSGLTLVDAATLVGGGFSGATVLRLPCRDGLFALRGWPASADPRRLRGLHRLLEHVAHQNVPVAVPLKTATGDTMLSHRERWWQTEPWLPGRADFSESPSNEKLSAVMATLAAFHTAAATFEPHLDESDWFGGPTVGPPRSIRDRKELMLRRVLGEERTMLAHRVPASPADEFASLSRCAVREFDRLGERIFRELRSVESITVLLQPVLRDVWHDHLLFTGDRVTGLVDPSAARADTVAADLSRLLGSLIGDDTPRWDAAIAVYVRHRPLSPDEAALIPILDRSGLLLSAATWLRRRYLFDEPCDTPAVTDRLREIVERLERL